MPRYATLFVALLALASAASTHAQSDPSNFDTVINVPGDPVPSQIGSNTQLNLSEGGALPELFSAGALDGTSSNVEVNISGGTVGESFLVPTGTTVNLSGGFIHGSMSNSVGSVVTMTGGEIGPHFSSTYDSFVILKGGTLGTNADLRRGAELVGGEFKFNGVDYTEPSISMTGSPLSGDLTGTLMDGSAFILSLSASDYLAGLKLTTVPLPSIESAPIIIDSSNDTAPKGLRIGQELTLRGDGKLGNNFATVDSTLAIEGGYIGRGLEVARSHVTITGGTIDNGSDPYERFFATHSTIVMSGGAIVGSVRLTGQSTLNMSGGSLSSLHLRSSSIANVSGGAIETSPEVLGGVLNLYGSSFALNGEPLIDLGLGETLAIEVDEQTQLSGTLIDGSDFDFQFMAGGRSGFMGTLTVTLTLPGDFNADGVVNLADYTVWRDHLGTTASLPGDLTPGTVTQNDYDLWKSHFGEVFTLGAPVTPAQVPEPTTAILLLSVAAIGWLAISRRPAAA